MKNDVNNKKWDKKCWGFFSKKKPKGIQELRELFASKNSEQDIKIAYDAFNIIQKRLNTISLFRDKNVQDFYESMRKKLIDTTQCEKNTQKLSF